MQVVLDVKDSEAPFLLELLHKFDFVAIADSTESLTKATPTFEAVQFNQPGFRFTREEANER